MFGIVRWTDFFFFSVFLNDISHTLSYFPDGEDLTGAATALLRLQDTYSLQTDKLARGEIDGAQRSQELSGRTTGHGELGGSVGEGGGLGWMGIGWRKGALLMAQMVGKDGV